MTRKQLIRALVFFLGIAIVLFGLNYLLISGVRHSEHAQTGKISLLMNHTIDPQIIVFGASNGETGIASDVLASQLDKTAFNMCLDGTSVLQFSDLVREYNAYSQQGETVVFAMGPFALESTGLPYAMNRYYAWSDNEYIKQNTFLKQLPEFNKLQHVPFYGFVLYDAGFYKSAFDGWSRRMHRPVLSSSTAHQGWVPMSIQWGENNSMTAEEFALKTDSSLVEEYKKLIKELKTKGRKVMVVIMPCQEQGMKKMRNYESFRKTVQTVGETADGYFDFSEDSMCLDKKYFYNYTHLNKTGAKYFSKMLGNKMKGRARS